MKNYITFKISGHRVAVPTSNNWKLEPTLINKSFTDEDGDEYINYRREKIYIYDTGDILFDQPMKKFDGLLFVIKGNKKLALKTESFFDEEVDFDKKIDVENLLDSIRE